MEAAARSAADDSPRDPDAGPLTFREVCGQSDDIRNGHDIVEAVAPRVDAEGFDLAELFESHFGVVLRFVGHGSHPFGCVVGMEAF